MTITTIAVFTKFFPPPHYSLESFTTSSVLSNWTKQDTDLFPVLTPLQAVFITKDGNLIILHMCHIVFYSMEDSLKVNITNSKTSSQPQLHKHIGLAPPPTPHTRLIWLSPIQSDVRETTITVKIERWPKTTNSDGTKHFIVNTWINISD